MKKVVILLAPGFEEVETVTPFDYLRRAGLEVKFAGIGGREIPSSRGMVIRADLLLEEVRAADFDAVVVPGGQPGSNNLAATPLVLELIKTLSAAGKVVGAICAAPAVVLGKTGLLTGRRFTCFPGMETQVTGGHFTEDRVAVDGNIVTSRAAGTSAEFALALVTLLAGSEAADKIVAATLQK
jgi:4-methyl-5(b-hydroxyethyl)-thiazole monophosphate biosynthesis